MSTEMLKSAKRCEYKIYMLCTESV